MEPLRISWTQLSSRRDVLLCMEVAFLARVDFKIQFDGGIYLWKYETHV